MKNFVALVIIVVIAMYSVVYAEGKITATQKNLFVYDNDDNGYFFAKLENTGDEPIGIDSGDLVIFDDNDEILCTDGYIHPIPSYITLDAGEYIYCKDFLWDKALENATIGDVKFSVGKKERTEKYERIPSDATFKLSGTDTFDNYAYISITNDTDEVRYGYYVVVALLDDEDNILFVENNQYDTLGIHPNSTVTVKMYVDNDLIKYYGGHGLKPTKVDSLVYYKTSD